MPWAARDLRAVSFIRKIIPFTKSLPLWHNHVPKTPSPNTITLGGRFQHINLGDTWTFGLPRWLSGKESTYQCKRRGFDPWVRKIHWRRQWQPTPVFLLGKSHGQRSLACCLSWGRKESDTTEWLNWTKPGRQRDKVSSVNRASWIWKPRGIIQTGLFEEIAGCWM